MFPEPWKPFLKGHSIQSTGLASFILILDLVNAQGLLFLPNMKWWHLIVFILLYCHPGHFGEGQALMQGHCTALLSLIQWNVKLSRQRSETKRRLRLMVCGKWQFHMWRAQLVHSEGWWVSERSDNLITHDVHVRYEIWSQCIFVDGNGDQWRIIKWHK